MPVKYILLIIVLLLPSFVCALSAPKQESRISIGVSPSVAPYVIKTKNSGLQLQILKSALNSQGVANIDIVYMSNKRAEQALEEGLVDIVMDYAGPSFNHIYKSQSLFSFQNVAISLNSRDYTINTTDDLLGKSVLAFFNSKVLQEIFDLGLAHIKETGEYSAIMAFDANEYAQVAPMNANPQP